jgi:hypothetical protein
MNTATASYPFDVAENGTDRVFTYKKAKLGLKTFFPMLWPSFILSCFLTYKTVAASEIHQTPTEKISMAIAYLPLYTIIIALAAVVVLNLLRRPETFVLNIQGIVLNGTVYPYKDIHSLYIKSPRGHVSHNLSGTSTGFMVVSNDRVQTIGLGAAGAVATATSGAVGAATQLSGAADGE